MGGGGLMIKVKINSPGTVPIAGASRMEGGSLSLIFGNSNSTSSDQYSVMNTCKPERNAKQDTCFVLLPDHSSLCLVK